MKRLCVALLGFGLGFLACATSNPREPDVEAGSPEDHRVRLEVYCGGGCSIWYAESWAQAAGWNQDNPMETWDGPGPWRQTFLAPSGTELVLRASAKRCPASVRAAIWVDGQEKVSDDGSCWGSVRTKL